MRDYDMQKAWRAAQASGDLVEYAKAARRMRDASVLAAELESVTRALEVLRKKQQILLAIAPRCQCGNVSEGKCAECKVNEDKAKELERYWLQAGVLQRWRTGSNELPEDRKQFIKTWWKAFRVTEGRNYVCEMPGCSVHVHTHRTFVTVASVAKGWTDPGGTG